VSFKALNECLWLAAGLRCPLSNLGPLKPLKTLLWGIWIVGQVVKLYRLCDQQNSFVMFGVSRILFFQLFPPPTIKSRNLREGLWGKFFALKTRGIYA